MTKRTLLAAVCILLSLIIVSANCCGYVGSVMERRQELCDMAARLASQQMNEESQNYDFPIGDIISCISDEFLQLGNDFTAARKEYGEYVNCEAEDCFWFYFVSPPWTWARGYGRAGWVVLSGKDLRQIKYFQECSN